MLSSMRRANFWWGRNQLPVKNNLNRSSPLGQGGGQAARPQMLAGEHRAPQPHRRPRHQLTVTEEAGARPGGAVTAA